MGPKGESFFISPNPICKNLVHCPHQRTPGNQHKLVLIKNLGKDSGKRPKGHLNF